MEIIRSTPARGVGVVQGAAPLAEGKRDGEEPEDKATRYVSKLSASFGQITIPEYTYWFFLRG